MSEVIFKDRTNITEVRDGKKYLHAVVASICQRWRPARRATCKQLASSVRPSVRPPVPVRSMGQLLLGSCSKLGGFALFLKDSNDLAKTRH